MAELPRNAQYDDFRRLLLATDTFTNTHTLEFYTAAMKVTWGVWNLVWWLVPGQDLTRVPLFGVLRELMPQWAWGLVGITLGACHLLTPIRHLRLRMFWLFAAFCFWAMITFMIFVHIPYNTGVPMYGGLTVVVGICYVRLYLVHGELFNVRNFLRPLWEYLPRQRG